MMSSGVTLSTPTKYIDFGDFGGTCVSDVSHCANGLTVSFWVKIPSHISTVQYILASSTLTDRGFHVKYASDAGKVAVMVREAYKKTQYSVKVQKGFWYNIVVSWSLTRLVVVVNSVRVNEVSGTKEDLNAKRTTHLVAGKISDFTGSSQVQLSNVAVWKSSMSADKIQEKFHCANFFLRKGIFILVPGRGYRA